MSDKTPYCSTARSIRATSEGYDTKPAREIFRETNMNDAMNPYGVKIREARDSEVNPESLAIIIGLDMTAFQMVVVRDGDWALAD